MILAYKILHGFMESIQWCGLLQMANTCRLRGHSLKLKNQPTRLHLRKFAISQRVVYMCDDLPAQVVVASTTIVFKTKQDAGLNTERVFVCCGLDYW